ncbi:hypothetical protein CH275_05445 [Rhodococcus sp. 06-235-1A]|uniref:hypothetical protein n=1 Tax=Rhodococcus sp. 06-235-1A TaxID=2022508 RepID=UPI000B9A81D9|nr:hypothetical protein [Rhodococcus sp. 06-235-1A]OZD08011.1 hypothetical protein CH275_05445 [Rhodococcus sp. 06-235-1A]
MLRKWLALIVVVILGAAWWNITTPDRPVAAIVAADSLECPVPYPIGQRSADPLARVPDDFVPTAAITCSPHLSETVAADRSVGYLERRWEGDFSRSIELLNRHSEHPAWFESSCDTSTYLLADLERFWLLDDHGRAVRAGFPVDSCGLPKPGGLAEIMTLTQASTTEHRIVLADQQIEDMYSCSAVYRPPNAGIGRPTGLSTGTTFCRFDSTTFDGTTSSDMPVQFDSLSFAPDCPSSASTVVTAQFSDDTYSRRQLTIELDGCHRVIPDGYAPLQASAALLASFS